MPTDSYFTGEPMRLAPGPQLLLDDLLVEDRMNLRRVMYQPVKHAHNPILMADQPWEGNAAYRPHVIWDESYGRYRMWYQCADSNAYHTGTGYVYFIGYAESDDAIHWEKPRLPEFPFNGHPATNILYAGDQPDSSGKRMFAGGQVFIDADDPDPERRYKMIGLDARRHPRHPELVNTEPNLICSPDGFHWKLTGERSILDHHSDTANHLVHDPTRGRWLLYCRPTVYSSGRDHLGGRHHRRRVSVMVSSDLQNWSYPRIVRVPDEMDWTDIDHTQVFRYGSHFLMLYAAMDGADTGRMVTRLASSPDGLDWQPYLTREDFLPLGPAGAWDGGILGPSCPPVTRGSSLLLYYLGANTGQMEAFDLRTTRYMGGGVAAMREDRFVAQRAGDATGFLLTREFLLEGETLQVNMASDMTPGRDASVRVEVVRHPELGYHADAWFREQGDTNAVPGFSLDDCVPVRGDASRLPVRWKEHQLAELRGQPVYLRFEVRHADLFGFRLS